MMTSPTCKICKRILTAPDSIKNGIGPECADRQQKFLSACGASLDEVAQLSLLDDATILKWLSKFAGAMRAGRIDHGKMFLDAARRACKDALPRAA